MLVEIAIPLEHIGTVTCDFDGDYHVEVMGVEVETDRDTYWRVSDARHAQRMRELGVEVDE